MSHDEQLDEQADEQADEPNESRDGDWAEGAGEPVSSLSDSDVRAALSVLSAVVRDRGLLAGLDRQTRVRFLELAGRVSRPERADQRRLAKALRRKDKALVQEEDKALLDATEIRALRRAPVFPTPPLALGQSTADGSEERPEERGEGRAEVKELREARKCYVCKAEYRQLHFFYDQLCPPCAELNYEKRSQTADLRSRVALVTGARVKIGYQAAILLLRAGAHVVVATRFPHDAALRYAREADYESFRDRLEIFGLDLRLTPSVERFARFLDGHLPRLDFIIHNACQTVRRPPGFYAHLVERELMPMSSLPPAAQPLVSAHHVERDGKRGASEAALVADPSKGPSSLGLLSTDSASLSQIALTPEDHALRGRVDLFPAGALDQDLQQIDLRQMNSWRLTLAEVPTVELLEVHLVNAIAPFVLSSRLKPLMMRHPSRDKHIVNVSAMEGQFYREHKTDKHPHTNMAKAALNMLTRTSAQDYVRDGIHINSVDTGWVTDEDPVEIALRKQAVHGFHPPLDIVDGAARICDPIFAGIKTGEHAFGQFFKDYKPSPW